MTYKDSSFYIFCLFKAIEMGYNKRRKMKKRYKICTEKVATFDFRKVGSTRKKWAKAMKCQDKVTKLIFLWHNNPLLLAKWPLSAHF